MREKRECLACGKVTPDYSNYCDWECHIAHAKAEGWIEHLPNGLPVRCIGRGLLTECEHGDHPDYKFPVEIEYTGDKEDVTDRDEYGEVMWCDNIQTHALIHVGTDVALTMYECNYSLISMYNGHVILSDYHGRGRWKLTEESFERVKRGKYGDL